MVRGLESISSRCLKELDIFSLEIKRPWEPGALCVCWGELSGVILSIAILYDPALVPSPFPVLIHFIFTTFL